MSYQDGGHKVGDAEVNEYQVEHVQVVSVCGLTSDGGDDNKIDDDTEKTKDHVNKDHDTSLGLAGER